MLTNLKIWAYLIFLGFTPFLSKAQTEVWSLEKCINHALQNNIDVRVFQERIQSSEIDLLQSKTNRLPSLNGNASHSYYWGRNVDRFSNTFTTNSIQSNNFSLSSSVVLFNGFQISNNIEKYKIENELAVENLNQIKNDISLYVASGYLTILMNKEALQVVKNEKENTESQVEKIKTMVEVGQLPQGDLLDIEAQLAQDEFNITTSENNLTLAYLNLTQLLQLSNEEAEKFRAEEPIVDEIEENYVLNNPNEVYETAVTSMPQINVQKLRVLSAEKDLLINKGKKSPTLSLGGSLGTGYSSQGTMASDEIKKNSYLLGYTSISNEPVIATVDEPVMVKKPFDIQLADNRNFNLGLQLSIPIFNNYSNRHNIARSKIELEIAQLNLEKEKNTLRNDINKAYTDALSALKKYLSAKKSETATEASYQNTKIKFEQNVVSVYEFNDLKNRYLRIQSELIQSKYDFIFKSKILDFYQGKKLTLK